MPARAILIVVIVRDAALRSALAAQLASLGVELLTVAVPAQARLRPDESAILVVDEADISGTRGEWVEILREGGWRRITVLTADVPPPAAGCDWLFYADKDLPAGTIAQAIADWAGIDRDDPGVGTSP